MLASSIPTKIAIPFASGAGAPFVRAIPATATTPGQASFSAGFPPVTFLPDTAGGINPDGRDFNGILQACTAWLQWLNAGGPVAYDAAFSASIGGYPKGAMLSNATTPGLFWISSADSNTTDPDSSGSVNWIGFPTAAIAVETARAQGVEATKAALAGSASQVFNVANAVTATEAVALHQLPSTWVDVTSSRSSTVAIHANNSGIPGTAVYTNSGVTPIKVSASGISGGLTNLAGIVNGVEVAVGSEVATAGITAGVYFDVPAGATYALMAYTSPITIVYWKEMY
jgi:hypothetical protein